MISKNIKVIKEVLEILHADMDDIKITSIHGEYYLQFNTEYGTLYIKYNSAIKDEMTYSQAMEYIKVLMYSKREKAYLWGRYDTYIRAFNKLIRILGKFTYEYRYLNNMIQILSVNGHRFRYSVKIDFQDLRINIIKFDRYSSSNYICRVKAEINAELKAVGGDPIV